MKVIDIYEAFKTVHPELSKNIISYGSMRSVKEAIKMRDKKGHLYIFKYTNDHQWSLYYGAAAAEYERSKNK